MLTAAAPLPLAPRALERARAALALAPLLFSGMLLLACQPGSGVRPAVLAAYGVAVIASCMIEVCAAPADASAKASRWLFCIALMSALGSEVVS